VTTDFPRQQADQLRIVQLNTGSLFEGGWEQRRHEIVAWLDQLQPDVVCFQEVHERDTDDGRLNTAGWIAAHADEDYEWCFGGYPLPRGMKPDRSLLFGSAVLSRWPIEQQSLHSLPLADPTSPLANFPWELFHARTAGLDLFSTHLAAAPTDSVHRMVQVQAIDDIITDTRGGLDAIAQFGQRRVAMPPILCGDFNAEPESDEIRWLCGLTSLAERTTFFQDAWRVAGDGGPGLTQDWRDNKLAAELNVHRKRIDYVFVGDPFMRAESAGRVLHAEVAFDTALTGVMASDHRGLVADVAWPTRPSEWSRPHS
jgi:endonuclease/exonuclease/phosphatase family metal-dependent hydrolase